MGKKRKPYDQRTDVEKIRSQWTKLSGLHSREEWSAAVVRAATAVELAVTFAIRSEFAKKGGDFSREFIDGLLKWANGLLGKIDKLLLPLIKDAPEKREEVKKLQICARNINEKRNKIVHCGEYCDEDQAQKLIGDCQKFVVGIVQMYVENFRLTEKSCE